VRFARAGWFQFYFFKAGETGEPGWEGLVFPGVKIHPTLCIGRRLARWAGVLAVLLLLAAGAHGATRWETLQAIHWVENPYSSPKPGPDGELGPYQFRERTWRMHTKAAFSRALDREHADEVAVKHYDWIKRGLVRAGMEVTPYNIALAWNGGLSATVSGRAPAAAHDYADRVSNLATQLSETRLSRNESR